MTEDLRQTHARLDEATSEVIDTITNLAATMKVLEAADEHATLSALEESETTLEALADFLDAIAEAADSDGQLDGNSRGALEELEPPMDAAGAEPEDREPSAEADGDEPERDNPFARVSPLRRLSAPYSILLNLERDLYADRIPRPYRMRKLKEIWGDLTRIGSPHPSDGLVARLSRLHEYLDSSGGSADGEPWSDDDRTELGDLIDRTAEIRSWSDDDLNRREREDWVPRFRDWVESAEEDPDSISHMTEMLTRLLTDLPTETTPDVQMLLDRLLDLEELNEDLRRRAKRAKDD